ncbi:MAG: 16S rRNA (cytidine(1402)-2'-O)-methyltransferase, partial [Acidobacteriota bacterium]|nr:16S rRNA (cytidine(1402)-2'-O)-methyltransferase [Acidobacteriota bacterium]
MKSAAGPGAQGTLFVVATPIGNLDDLSPRALSVLRAVPWIACEDTRVARRLRTHFGLTARL